MEMSKNKPAMMSLAERGKKSFRLRSRRLYKPQYKYCILGTRLFRIREDAP